MQINLYKERAIYWQEMSAVEYAAARRANELGWPYEATGHQHAAAGFSLLARGYLTEYFDSKPNYQYP